MSNLFRAVAMLLALAALLALGACSGQPTTQYEDVKTSSAKPPSKPTAVPAVTPAKASAPVLAHFYDNGSTAGAGHTIVKWEWKFQGGGLPKADRKWVDYTSTHGDVWKTLTKSAQGKLRVTDETGRRSVSSRVRVRVNHKGNASPIADIEFATLNMTDFNFDASGSYDPDGTIVNYEWDLDNDGVYEISGANNAPGSFPGGAHTVSLRVTDNSGATDVESLELTANFPPIAAIEIATANGTTFSFNADGSSDPEGPIFKWEWDFDGDGIYEETYFVDPGNISHSFTGGDHEVSLRVTDGIDASDTETITVTGNYPPNAMITVVHEFPSSGERSFVLSFAGSNDVEGPIFDALVATGGGAPEPWDINDELTVSIFEGDEPYSLVLTVRDGLWATGVAMASISFEDGVMIAIP